MIGLLHRHILPRGINDQVIESLNEGAVLKDIPKGADRVQAIFDSSTRYIDLNELKHVGCSFNPIRFIASFLSYFFDFSKLIERAVKSLIKTRLNKEKEEGLKDLMEDSSFLATEADEDGEARLSDEQLVQKHPYFKPSEIRLFQQTSLTADELLQQGKGNWSKIKQLARNNNEHEIPVDRIRDNLGLLTLSRKELDAIQQLINYEVLAEPSETIKLVMSQVYRQRMLLSNEEWQNFISLLPRREADLLERVDQSIGPWQSAFEEFLAKKIRGNLKGFINKEMNFKDHRNSTNDLARFYREQAATKKLIINNDVYNKSALERYIDDPNLLLILNKKAVETKGFYIDGLKAMPHLKKEVVETTIAPNGKLFSPLGSLQHALKKAMDTVLSPMNDPEEMQALKDPYQIVHVEDKSIHVHFFAKLREFTEKEGPSIGRIYLSYQIPIHSEELSTGELDFYTSSPSIEDLSICYNGSPRAEKCPTEEDIFNQIDSPN